MKKFRTLLAILLAFAMVFSLSSCIKVDEGESSSDDATTEAPAPELNYTADELFKKIDEKMDSYDSYESTLEMIMNVTMNGVEVNTTAKGIDIRRGLTTDNFEFYSESEMKMSMPGLSTTEKITTVEAYHGGNYFISNRGSNVSQKIYSPMTAAEAEEYMDEDDTDIFEFGDCVNKEAEINEDGTYTLDFSGYTAKAVNEILDKTGLDTSIITHDLVDITFHILADAEFNVISFEISFVFEQKPGDEKMPEILLKGTYSKYNEALIDAAKVNPEKYTAVDDVRLIDEMKELLDEKYAKEDGSFTLDISQTLKIMGETQQSNETDIVTYGKNDKGYFYDIDADMNGTKYDISYSLGAQTVVAGGQSQVSAQTEAEARAFIENLINTCQFKDTAVIGVKKISDNKYSFTCEPKAAYKTLIEQMGATFRSVTQTITVTVENGEIVNIESEAVANGAVTQGNNTFQLTFTLISNVKFDK
jgi:hypothetical protein